jgi:hypothetical protein
MRYDFPLLAPLAIFILGNMLHYTVSPLLGAALMTAIFSPLPVPARFGEEFPHGFVVRPSQIRTEAQDAVTMIPGASGIADDVHDLRLPVTIMAGNDDRIVGYEDTQSGFTTDPRQHLPNHPGGRPHAALRGSLRSAN